MKRILLFLRVTIVGGILFLVPVIVLTIVLAKALDVARMVVGPLATSVPMESVGGVGVAKLLAISVIIVFCFFTGMFAKTAIARKMINWMENALLSNMPGYTFMKGMGESIAGVESGKSHEAVIVEFDDAWQIAFLVERMEGGKAAVFVPDAPTPWSGSVYIMTENRIKSLGIPAKSALDCLRRVGQGANALLKERF